MEIPGYRSVERLAFMDKMFFTDIHKVEPHLRVSKTYEFLEQHTTARIGNGKTTSQHKWLELLDSVVENQL